MTCYVKMILKAMFLGLIVACLGGCISPRTDAFLLGAGIGAGTTAYFLNGGSIAGYSMRSLQNGSRNPTSEIYQDYSVPSELEWHFMGEEIFSEAQQTKKANSGFFGF